MKGCMTCGGTGEVDSGGMDPQGNFIKVACPDCSNEEAARSTLIAIAARINGEWDNPHLVKFGPLSTSTLWDVRRILQAAGKPEEPNKICPLMDGICCTRDVCAWWAHEGCSIPVIASRLWILDGIEDAIDIAVAGRGQ